MLSRITTALADDGINIENMGNGSKGEYAYTIVDTGSKIPPQIADELAAIEGIIRVRVIG